MKQNALSVIVPIMPEREHQLRAVLETIGSVVMGSGDNHCVNFSKSPATHFARWAILEDNDLTRDQNNPCRLFFSSNFDGKLDAYLKELVEVMGPGMEEIWNKCVGYPPQATKDLARFKRFIKHHSVKNQAFYNGFPGVSVKEILSSIRVREVVNRILDHSGARQYLSLLLDLLFAVQQRHDPGSRARVERPNLEDLHGKPKVKAIPRLLERIVGLRHDDAVNNPNAQVQTSTSLIKIEDMPGIVQNQMTAITPIKPGLLPRIILKIWLGIVINRLAGLLSPPMTLNGITTIHFARWAIIDNGKNLLFESNYDGSWEKYIDDFVDLSAFGMNMIWANCTGYPIAGCHDIDSFKVYIRQSQLPTQVFYSAYPQETVHNIINDLVCSRAVEKLLEMSDYNKAVAQLLRQKEVRQFLSGRYSFP